MFELVEEAFDAVAATIKEFVAGRFLAARAHWRDDRFDAVGGEALADAVGVVASIERGELQNVVRVEAFVEGFKLPPVVGLAWSQVERDGAVFVEGRRVDLGGEPSARASQSLLRPVFFGAPAACWCARTVVESRSKPRASAKGAACSFFHNRCQTPRASQRRKRM